MTISRFLCLMIAFGAALNVTAVGASFAGWPAPPRLPPSRPVVDDYFGTKVVDRYRYFENTNDPVVRSFLRKQNEYARSVLARLEPERQKLLKKLAAIDDASSSVEGVTRIGNLYFYEKRSPGDNLTRLYYRHAGRDDEHVLIDPGALTKGTIRHYSIKYFLASPNGRYVAYGLAEGGSENSTLHVVDVLTRTVLPDSIDRVNYIGVTGWLPNCKTFAYMRYPKLTPGESPDDAELRPVVYLHTLGSSVASDRAIFGYGVDPSIRFKPNDDVIVTTTPVSRDVIGIVEHGVQDNVTLYVTPIASLVSPGRIPWRKIVDVDDDVTGRTFEWIGSSIYLLTYQNAPNYKLVMMSLQRPNFKYARTVFAPQRDVIETISLAKDGLYIRSRDGGFGKITRITIGVNRQHRTMQVIEPPYPGAIDTLATDTRVDGATFGLATWLQSQRYYFAGPSGRVRDARLEGASTVDTSAFASAEVYAPSTDGVKVPMSLVFRKSMSRDGTAPTDLVGYGAYGQTIAPHFLGPDLAWLQEGGTYAVCHPRGGGWYGAKWHEDGMLRNKQHTIDDFVSCARYLISHKYTTSQHLAADGTSAGAIAVGRAITQHPELFAAALDINGYSDALRSEFSPNGPPNVPEFGTVKNPLDVPSLLNMDAYLHVVDGTSYPAVLLNTGLNDSRVPTWEAAKFAARLEAASVSGRPVLLRVGYDEGHGFMDTSRKQSEALSADEYAFLLWQLGDPRFANVPAFIGKRGKPFNRSM